MNLLELHGLSKTFGSLPVLRDLTFDVAPGEFISIFGPNGCGKTTLLNIIAGLDSPDSANTLSLSVERNEVAFVFQDYRRTLLPWRNVRRNIELPLLIDGQDARHRSNKVDRLVSEFGIDLDLNSDVTKLSGGQAQTICMLRALVRRPRLLILDEPFTALDYEARVRLQLRTMACAERNNLTVIFVSHDLDEALFLSDRTLILSRRPATITQVVLVDLPRPRKLIDQTTDTYNSAKLKAIASFNAIAV